MEGALEMMIRSVEVHGKILNLYVVAIDMAFTTDALGKAMIKLDDAYPDELLTMEERMEVADRLGARMVELKCLLN